MRSCSRTWRAGAFFGFIGATTENPFFEVNSALISRSRVIELEALSDEDIASIVRRALEDERGLKGEFELTNDARSMRW